MANVSRRTLTATGTPLLAGAACGRRNGSAAKAKTPAHGLRDLLADDEPDPVNVADEQQAEGAAARSATDELGELVGFRGDAHPLGRIGQDAARLPQPLRAGRDDHGVAALAQPVQELREAAQLSRPAARGPVSPHSFRRTVASWLIAEGEDVAYAMGQLRHRSEGMTWASTPRPSGRAAPRLAHGVGRRSRLPKCHRSVTRSSTTSSPPSTERTPAQKPRGSRDFAEPPAGLEPATPSLPCAPAEGTGGRPRVP